MDIPHPPCYLAFTIYDLEPLLMVSSSVPKKSRFLSDFGLGIVAIGFVFGGLRVACYHTLHLHSSLDFWGPSFP